MIQTWPAGIAAAQMWGPASISFSSVVFRAELGTY
jgi:hypothetical protein